MWRCGCSYVHAAGGPHDVEPGLDVHRGELVGEVLEDVRERDDLDVLVRVGVRVRVRIGSGLLSERTRRRRAASTSNSEWFSPSTLIALRSDDVILVRAAGVPEEYGQVMVVV